MTIYEMTATFGKLEQEKLVLRPGLNVIEAPNEWGKSTWCAFLMAMFYGMDTRAKSSRTVLADKERYAPWSGSPMAGRIDLRWKDRDITIERSSKGRIPLGQFRAYETRTGLEVPELTGENCGAVLLGVEQSVFRRSGFIRQSEMPVARDEALRRRLNSLVTTGEESAEADRLEDQLKELRNRCRYNRSGLLPQAEARREQLEKKLEESGQLEEAIRKQRLRLEEVKDWLSQLENHENALAYAEAEADAARVAEANEVQNRAERRLAAAEAACGRLPSAEEAEKKISQIRSFREEWARMQEDLRNMPPKPEKPEVPALYRGKSMERCEEMTDGDIRRYELLTRTKPWLPLLLAGGAVLLLLLPAAVLGKYLIAAFCLIAGTALLVPGLRKKAAWDREAEDLRQKYGSDQPEQWQNALQEYRQAEAHYEKAMAEYRAARGDMDIRETFLKKQRQSLCGSQTAENVLEIWQKVLVLREEYRQACREFQRAEKYCATLQAMAKPLGRLPGVDLLTCPAEETRRLMKEAREERQRLENRMGQYQGRMDALGDREVLEKELRDTQQRIRSLEMTVRALTLALDTLSEAKLELQRKFAPRIARRTQELLGAMTGGRYARVTIGEDFSLLAGTAQEEILRQLLWRSDGTVDQLYFALRLAVAEALTPEAPLILDDAFVRFDDERLKAALEILKQQSREKQILLFTCQSREKAMLQ